jgi:hypothetical protein
MIALDSSSLIAFLTGEGGGHTALVEQSLTDRQAFSFPWLLTEILSDPKLPKPVEELLLQLPRLEVLEGYWERAGSLRAKVLGGSGEHFSPIP